MKKITLLDFDKNRTRKTKRWLGWLTFCMMVFGQMSFAQVLNESFDSTTIPLGWTQEYVSGTTNWSTVTANGNSTIFPRTGARMAEFRIDNSSSTTKLITPSLDLTNLSTPQLTFYYANVNWLGDIDELRVYYKTSASGSWIQIGDDYVDEKTSWEKVEIILPDPSADYYIAFEAKSNWARGLNLDDVTIEEGPSCLTPSALTALNPTLTSIDLSWNGYGGTTGNYEIKWGAVGFDIDAATAIPVTGLTYTLNGTGGNYAFVVREICDTNDESSWSAPYSFSIPNVGDDCSAPIVIATLPYTTTDDTANYTDNPNIEGSPGDCTTSNYLNGNDVVYAYTATFDGIVDIKLTELTANWSGIFAYASCADIGTACIGSAFGSGATDRGFELNVADGDTYYFVISTFASPQTVGYTLDISQVLCAKPTGVAHTDVTHNSANLSWDVLGDYEINWGVGTFVAGDGANTDTVTATTEFAFTGLNGSTTYRYFVRQNCGGTDGDSDWVGPFTFTTLLTPASIPWLEPFTGTTLPTGWANTSTWTVSTSATIVPGAEGSYLYKEIYGTTGTNGAMFSTLRMGLVSVGDILSFDYGLRKYGTTYTAQGTISIEISTDNGVTYSPFQTITHSDDVAWMSSEEYDLSAYAGEFIRIRIIATRSGTTDDYYLGFDNFYVGQPITCEAPTALTASNITTNTADLSWSSDGSTFDISWGAGTFDAADGTIVAFSNGGTLSGLNSQTTYQYYVRQDCGTVDGISMWVGPFSFTTDCDPVISLDENFDSYTTGNIVPECWTRLAPTTSVGSQTITSTSPASGNRNIYQYATASQNPVIVVLPSFSNINDGTHWLKFKARVGSGAPGALHVGYVTDATDYDSFMLIETLSITNTSYTTDAEYTVVVPTSVPAGAKLAIKNAADGKSYYWDDVIWEETPTCLAPTALIATGITHNSADFGWSGDGVLFDVEIVEEGETPTGVPSHTGVANGFTTTGLTPSTSYDFYVRQDCGVNGTSIWVGPFSFTTECLPPSITSTTGDTICGQGEANLTATADVGASIAWYADETGGTALGEGSTFTTPLISETTSYWVEASEIGGMQSAGKPNSTGANGTFAATNNWGIRFTANEAVTLESVMIYALASGTMNVKVTDGAGVELYETGNISVINGGVSSPQIIPLNFAVTPGDYRITVKSTTSGLELVRDNSSLAFPYVGGDGAISVTSGDNGSATTAAYYYFYDLKYVGKCASERTEVVATVTDAPDFSLSETTVDICEGETTDTIIVTTGVSDYDTYVWEPSAGVIGDEITGWTFNPTETTTYILTASQSSGAECVVTAEVQVNVNPLPMAITVIGTEEICENGIIELSVTGNINNGTAVLGDGITAPANTANAPNPLSSYYGGAKHQMLYTAAELTAQGMIPGSIISEVTFDLAGTGGFCTDFTIRMGATTVDVMSSGFVSGTTTVYGPATFTPTSIGLVSFELTTPYVWDGISNLVVETVHNAGNTGNGSGSNTRYTETLSNSVAYIRSDNTSGGIAGFDALTTTPTFSKFRPNMTFVHSLEQTNITWSPATALYTDEDATIPYVAETYSTTVYFKSSTEGNFNYTATSYTDFDCSVSDDIVITVNEAPEQPVLACYETATFNAATCQWEVSGEQPEQPVLACYETATFNTTTCQWEVSGEQPEEPVLACYETATFNPTTCEWDVVGEQPEEPVVACYETATFNEVTCEWDVTGTAPAAPTADSPQSITTAQTIADIIVNGENLTWYLDSDLTTVIDETFEFSEGSYTLWVTQTIEGCESVATQIEVEVTLSTDRFDNASFRTYPNPVKDVFYVSYSKEITSVSVVNILGQTVIEKSVNATDTQIDMTSLPTGSYFVKVNVEGNSKTVKVIKQ